MDDVIGIKVLDAKRGWVGLMTWGRLWDSVDESDLLKIVREHLRDFGIDEPSEVQTCSSLRELSSAEFFHEAILAFSWDRPEFGTGRDAWKALKRNELERGRDIYFLGALQSSAE